MDDFDIDQSKIGEISQRIVDRAMEDTRRRGNSVFTSEHLFLAAIQIEWDVFV